MSAPTPHVRVLRPVPATGMPISELAAFLAEAERDFPGVSRLGMGGFSGRLCITDMDVPDCGCMTCDEANRAVAFAGDFMLGGRFMIVCPSCGDKRCPHAHWHGYDCPVGAVRVSGEEQQQ